MIVHSKPEVGDQASQVTTYRHAGETLVVRGSAEQAIIGSSAAKGAIASARHALVAAHYWGHPALHYWGPPAPKRETSGGIAQDVYRERCRQVEKWGLQERASGTDANEWHEYELAAKKRHDQLIKEGALTWVDILAEEVYEAFAEEDPDALRVELIQVMAVAASWIQDLDRRGDQAP